MNSLNMYSLKFFLLFMFTRTVFAGYGIKEVAQDESPQADVSAPRYSPSYSKYQRQPSYGTYSSKPSGGVKTAGVKTSGVKTSGTSSRYTVKAPACNVPRDISNAQIQCNSLNGICKIQCIPGYQFPNGNTIRAAQCSYRSGVWSWLTQFPEYPLTQPCEPICRPECQNNGICIAPDQCECAASFTGPQCQHELRPCVVYPPLPMNAHRSCSAQMCTIKCMERHQFPDGTKLANMNCREGQWTPTRADWVTVPDCQPICDPPCLNGGACLSLNMCQCPLAFRGPQCQYSSSACSVAKLGFNGGYSCSGDAETFWCELRCQPPASYSSPPAPRYTCLYSTGQFEPQPIPLCNYGDNQVISQGGSSQSVYHPDHAGAHKHHFVTPGVHHPLSETPNPLRNESGLSEPEGGYLSTDELHSVAVLPPAPGLCFTWGGAHYKTFDGQVYSFQSPCRHVLVRDSREHLFSVVVQHGGCRTGTLCPSRLSIFLQDKEYSIGRDEEGGVTFSTSKRQIPIPARLPGLRVSLAAHGIRAELEGVGASLLWDTHQMVQVVATESLWNRTEGLCGVLDGHKDTDLLTAQRQRPMSIATLADSWEMKKLGDVCDESPSVKDACDKKSEIIQDEAERFCKKLLTNKKFSKCSKVMDISLLLDACQWDYCSCAPDQDPEACACASVAVYVKQCVLSGVSDMRGWRDEGTCPMKCTDGKIYKACGPESQPSCFLSSPTTPVSETSCTEGCFCPEGLYLNEEKCIPKQECPCRLRNRNFESGAVIPKGCNTCKCEAGEWTCTQLKCGARCGAIGDPHYTTFDGRRFDFMGQCSYHLLKGENYTVDVENVACPGAISDAMNLVRSPDTTGSPSCTKAVTIVYDAAVIKLNQRGIITVNGVELKVLPSRVDDVVVRAASSLFLIVELPNGIDVWWDTVTRVFVDVPESFRGNTKGLCGTFNDNQKDDFLTPEGDVEQTAGAFADKWRASEACGVTAPALADAPDSCRRNVQNREVAETYCRKLKGELFKACHWHVDVEPFYEDCLYDMCACDGDIAACMCPLFGAYATECAAQGVKIDWRLHFKECELPCSGGQSYQVCADSCTRTCSDVSRNMLKPVKGRSACKPRCVEGCACAPGQALHVNGECIPVGMCPCHHGGLEFRPGYKEVRDGKTQKLFCTCEVGKWKCRAATPEEILTYPRASDIQDQCSADANLEFTTCESAHPITCKNMHVPQSSTTAECRPGCQCRRGYVLDAVSRNCVLPANCPCHHGGRSYPDGHKRPEECNTCECKQGKWECTERQCNGVCSAWGDSHFTTFDGKEFDFQGVCTYRMAQGVQGDNAFTVEIQNEPCGTTGATCAKSITLLVRRGAKEERAILTKHNPIPDTSSLESIKSHEAGAFVFLNVFSLGLVLQWDKNTRVYIKIDPKWKNRVKGLCGNYNEDVRDDFQSPSGGGISETSALLFADSWKLMPTCSNATSVKDHCEERPFRKEWAIGACGALHRAPFTACHSEVPPAGHAQRCERDACACDSGGDCECVCIALATYAQLCAARGVIFKWRSKDLCPCQCDEEISAYDPCIIACPEETCENTLDYSGIKTTCQEDTCVEGCKLKKKCPQGMVFSNDTLAECVERAACRPTCMTLADGRVVLEGEMLEEDECHTCRCSRRQRVCSGQPCSTVPPASSSPAVMTTTTAATSPSDTTPTAPSIHEGCTTGWSLWVSRQMAVTNNVSGHEISTAREKLPSVEDLVNSLGLGVCQRDMMTDIECRTIEERRPSKDVRAATACSLDRGLTCRALGPDTCPNFEIRVFCQCDQAVGALASTRAFPQCLDAARPNHEHPTDCHKFYQCAPGSGPPQHPHLVEKTCGPDMWYNPDLMICDYAENVKRLRPFCADDIAVGREVPPQKPEATTDGRCEVGEVWSECAVACDRLCHGYAAQLKLAGKCGHGEACQPGCVPVEAAARPCAPGELWRDRAACVPRRDCTCAAHSGAIVKPGGVKMESCEVCQCHDNVYSCDDSQCVRKEKPLTEGRKPGSVPSVLIVAATTSPPPVCGKDRYKYVLWDGSIPVTLNASSFESEDYSPRNAKLNGNEGAGAWTPTVSDVHQYLEVQFPSRQPLYGLVTQGSSLFSEYVTSYRVLYSDDGQTYSNVNGPDGQPMVFLGSRTDSRESVKQMFPEPIEAKYLRVQPLTWHERIALRFDVIGCSELTTPAPSTTTSTSVSSTTATSPVSTTVTAPFTSTTVTSPRTSTTIAPLTATSSSTQLITSTITSTTPAEQMQCTEPMGIAGGLPLKYVQVSSETGSVKSLDINQDTAWKPTSSTPGEWIFFDFTSPRNITGIKTKGGKDGWVKSYKVLYSPDHVIWSPVTDDGGSDIVFLGNFDSDTEVKNMFPLPIYMQYLKLLPQEWSKHIEMRVEPIGCFLPVAVTDEAAPPCTEPIGLSGGMRLQNVQVSSGKDNVKNLAINQEIAWRPTTSTPGEWIFFDFTTPRNITGVVTKGGKTGWVTSYKVLYSPDHKAWSAIVDDAGYDKVFPANVDPETEVRNVFPHPVLMQVMKILPQEWSQNIEMRVEPLGCLEPHPVVEEEPLCSEPMGFSNGLPLTSVQVSSEPAGIANLDLNGKIAWRPTFSTPGEWIFFDFTSLRNITGVVTKGGKTGWVKSYKVLYSPDHTSWSPITDDTGNDKLFPANFDSETEVKNMFPRPIHMQYMKILPQEWSKNMELRVEPLGCFLPYPVSEQPAHEYTIPPDSLVAEQCRLCPGLVSGGACHCSTPKQYFDGEECTTLQLCPCFVGLIPYQVGATFKNSNCEDCTCKIGGVPDCVPAKCPKCGSGLVARRSPLCECACEPCAAGQRACPTSDVCVPEEKWCDGVTDCPDDELDCPTTTAATTAAPPTTTTVPPKKSCAEPSCPVGYRASLVARPPADPSVGLPPPRARMSYTRYFKGVKGGSAASLYSGTKTMYPGTKSSSAFTLSKPIVSAAQPAVATAADCPQFKCVSTRKLPPFRANMTSPPPPPCAVPACPPTYRLQLEKLERSDSRQCPKYTCVPPPKRDAVCKVIGRTFNTFDGTEYKYDICDHLLARDAHGDKWSVIIQKNCTKASGCARELLVVQDSEHVRILPRLRVEYNGHPYTVDQTKKIGLDRETFLLSRNGDFLFYVSKKYGFWVAYSLQADVRIGVPTSLSGAVDGLCGYYDGSPENDRRLPAGQQVRSTELFGEAWSRPELPPDACEARVCPLDLQARAWDMCSVIAEQTLSSCGKVMDLDKWRTRCLERVCECAQAAGATAAVEPRGCVCEALQGFVSECQAADRALDLQGWRTETKCPAECPSPLVHHDCYRRRCEPSCSPTAAAEPCPAAPDLCFPGCFCPEGKLRKGDDCINPQDCRDCICDGKGTPAKYTTFERAELPFSGNCTYIAARDKKSKEDYKFQVFVTNGACEDEPKLVCTEAVHIMQGPHVLHVQKSPGSSKLDISVDGAPVYKSVKSDWLTLTMLPGNDVSILIPEIQLEVTSLFKNMDFNVRVPSYLYANKTEGLCGSCGGLEEELRTQNGTATTDIQQYGLSWLAGKPSLAALDIKVERACVEKPKNECLPPPPDQDPCFKILDPQAFGKCHVVVEPFPFVLACQQDMCGTGRQAGVCSSLEQYATECRRAGLCVDWRTAELCPYPCTGNLEYKSCGLGCTLTCENYKDLSKNPKKCDMPTSEGCFCPDGKVLVNNTCIEHTKCFPCDADQAHYAGDEWEVDACTKCSCVRSEREHAAHVTCTKLSCAPPACAPDQLAERLPAAPTECCPKYICVPKATEGPQCEEPQKISCGFGQELKLERSPNGCKKFSCQCKPASLCEPLPNDNEVTALEPGIERLVDRSGCCPREQLVCRRDSCPQPPACAQFRDLRMNNATGKCCPEYECVLPEDKCIVSLEWESKPEGGERRRAQPQTVLQPVSSAWVDGACRSCRCVRAEGAAPAPQCAVTACAPVASSEHLLVEPLPVPYQCCPLPRYVACKHADRLFKAGENLTLPEEPCVSYECVSTEEGKLEKRTSVRKCDTDCQPGWEYVPAASGGAVCCGRCEPVACVVEGTQHAIGAVWHSADHCTTYRCESSGAEVTVHSEVVSCPIVPEQQREEFVLNITSVPGECCKKVEPVACKVGGRVYQEGETWATAACANATCSRGAGGVLARVESVASCSEECPRGASYRPAADPRVCCGQCWPTACVDGEVLRAPNTTWMSEDNCTTLECSELDGQLVLSSHSEDCPDVSGCPAANLYTKGCCRHCRPSAASQTRSCSPEAVAAVETVGAVRYRHGGAGACTNPEPIPGFTACSGGCPSRTRYNTRACIPQELSEADTVNLVVKSPPGHGECTNKAPIVGFKQCRGDCPSNVTYNKHTNLHDQYECTCCRPEPNSFTFIKVDLTCPSGRIIQKTVPVPSACACVACSYENHSTGGGNAKPIGGTIQ